MQLTLPERVDLVEVGLRDGLQVVERPVPTSLKVGLVEMMISAGVRHIEAASFAHPSVLPQLADAEEVMARVPRVDGVRYRALVPNLRGAERAAACGLDDIVALTSTDDAITRINQGRSAEDTLRELEGISKVVHDSGASLIVGIATAFFAVGSGVVAASKRNHFLDTAVDAGASGVYLACSSGMDDPQMVYAGVSAARDRYPEVRLGVHLHARNGMALANALAALMAGADWLEGSFGGLGGDLWAPGDKTVLGNAPFEDLVNLVDCIGVRSGVDLAAYLDVVRAGCALTDWVPQSFVLRGGTRQALAEHVWADTEGERIDLER